MPVKYTTRIDEHAKRVRKDAAQKSIPLSELFTADFMRAHTNFDSLAAMMEAGDFESATPEEWDAFVKGNTQFSTWQEMMHAANAERAKRAINED